MCHRAKSPRKVREKVPAPNPPTGAPCQKPSSMWPASRAGFFVPALSKGCPMGRFHAALGIFSPPHAVRARVKRMNKRVACRRTYVLMKPPKIRPHTQTSRTASGSPNETRQMIIENRYSCKDLSSVEWREPKNYYLLTLPVCCQSESVLSAGKRC